MSFQQKTLFYLKVSRPGLWFATIWLYLLPTGQMAGIWQNWIFWYGLFYICFPLNFMVYGWNDMVDRETDSLNPRKDSFWFGARGSKEQLAGLWKPIIVVQALFFPPTIYFAGPKVLILVVAFLIINGLYNLPKGGLRGRPPLELTCQLGYLFIVPLSVWLNDTGPIPPITYLYLFLFAVQSHLIGEVMDIEPDRKAGRKTTATTLGIGYAKILIMAVVLAETLLLFLVYREYVFGGMLAAALIWLLLDLLVFFKTRNYTVKQMKLFAVMSNIVALTSMAYVWYTGCLLAI